MKYEENLNSWKGEYVRNKIISMCRIIPDKLYLQLLYWKNFGKFINFENPLTFNEKIQWLKLYDRNPQYTKMVDKYEVREVVNKKIGKNHNVKLLGVWDDPSKIDYHSLPQKFVLKVTRGKGVVICEDKEKLDIRKATKYLWKHYKNNLFWYGREWPYKDVPPRIVAEEYLSNNEKDGLIDYKVHCFNGQARIIQVVRGRFSDNIRESYYDNNWIPSLQIFNVYNKDVQISKPKWADELISFSELIAQNIPLVRVDWYSADQKLLLGEITFYPRSGFIPFVDVKSDLEWGTWIDLKNIGGEKTEY